MTGFQDTSVIRWVLPEKKPMYLALGSPQAEIFGKEGWIEYQDPPTSFTANGKPYIFGGVTFEVKGGKDDGLVFIHGKDLEGVWVWVNSQTGEEDHTL